MGKRSHFILRCRIGMRSSVTLANSLYLSDPNFFNYKLRAGGLDHFKCAFLLGKMREGGAGRKKMKRRKIATII